MALYTITRISYCVLVINIFSSIWLNYLRTLRNRMRKVKFLLNEWNEYSSLKLMFFEKMTREKKTYFVLYSANAFFFNDNHYNNHYVHKREIFQPVKILAKRRIVIRKEIMFHYKFFYK